MIASPSQAAHRRLAAAGCRSTKTQRRFPCPLMRQDADRGGGWCFSGDPQHRWHREWILAGWPSWWAGLFCRVSAFLRHGPPAAAMPWNRVRHDTSTALLLILGGALIGCPCWRCSGCGSILLLPLPDQRCRAAGQGGHSPFPGCCDCVRRWPTRPLLRRRQVALGPPLVLGVRHWRKLDRRQPRQGRLDLPNRCSLGISLWRPLRLLAAHAGVARAADEDDRPTQPSGRCAAAALAVQGCGGSAF